MIKINRENKAWQSIKIILSIVIVTMCAMTIVAAASGSAYDVTIIDGERSIRISTKAEELNAVFGEANVSVDSNDIINDSKFVPGQESTVVITRGYDVTLSIHGEEKAIVGYKTVAYTLKNENIKLDDENQLNCKLTDNVYDAMKIVIANEITVKVKVEGKTITKETTSASVGNILKAANVKLSEDDIVKPAVDTVITKDAKITVKRVSFKNRKESEKISFNTKYENCATLAEGTYSVKKAGVNGEKTVEYLDKFVDGKLKSSEVLSSKVTKKAVTEVLLKGTKKVAKNTAVKASGSISSIKTVSNFKLPSKYSLDSNLVPTSYKRKLTGSGTAYYGGYRTSVGKVPQPGYIAVNPKIIPYGSKLWIVSNDGKVVYGYAIAADTGGFATNGSGTIADLYFNSYGECVNFGRRNITIYVL